MKFRRAQWSPGAAGGGGKTAETLFSIISSVKNIWRLSAEETINAFIPDQKLPSFPFCLVFRIPPILAANGSDDGGVPVYFLYVHRGVSFNSLGLFHVIKATRNRQRCLLPAHATPGAHIFFSFGFDPIWTVNREKMKPQSV